MDLKGLRKQVDSLDAKIVGFLNQRTLLTTKIGKIKAKGKAEVYSPDRERQIYKRITRLNRGPLPVEAVKAIYREIMSSSLAMASPIRIAYLGPVASFTHLAALKKFGSQVQHLDCSSIAGVFSEVEKGHVNYGVVPIENSIEGAVDHTLDMFIDSDLRICSEITLEVFHNLLANCTMSKIKRLYSNPQVFGQCRLWLDEHLASAERIEVSSTSKAAEMATEKKNSACIASRLAAKYYNLRILAESIQDAASNITRFLVIGKAQGSPTKEDKTSILFSIKDRVGALYDMLYPFKKYGINLTKIESRPSRKKAWEYYFFVDLKGHAQEEKVKKALREIKKRSTYLKVLGSYPVSG